MFLELLFRSRVSGWVFESGCLLMYWKGVCEVENDYYGFYVYISIFIDIKIIWGVVWCGEVFFLCCSEKVFEVWKEIFVVVGVKERLGRCRKNYVLLFGGVWRDYWDIVIRLWRFYFGEDLDC